MFSLYIKKNYFECWNLKKNYFIFSFKAKNILKSIKIKNKNWGRKILLQKGKKQKGKKQIQKIIANFIRKKKRYIYISKEKQNDRQTDKKRKIALVKRLGHIRVLEFCCLNVN